MRKAPGMQGSSYYTRGWGERQIVFVLVRVIVLVIDRLFRSWRFDYDYAHEHEYDYALRYSPCSVIYSATASGTR